MSTHEAWSLVCRLFAGGTPVFRGALSPAEIGACTTLGPAIKPTVISRTFTLCPYCQLRNGQVFGDGQGGQVCQCSDCGPIPLAANDLAAVMLDKSWLRSKLRMALEIESRDGFTDLGNGVWRLGEARRGPALLAPNLVPLCVDPSVFDRVRVAGATIRVITPASVEARRARLPAGVEWLPLDERFAYYGGGISFLKPGEQPAPVESQEPWTPVFGPFSADFRWVTLSDRPAPIRCSEGQAAVFGALWDFKGQKITAETVMTRAGLNSDKPNDIFKVRARDKGKQQYEDQHHAYVTLVQAHKRDGLYWMPCASPDFAAA
jgi:hypothetical protein